MKKSKLIIAIFIVLFSLAIGIVNLQSIGAETLTSEANVSYDTELFSALNSRNLAIQLINQKNFIGLEIINNETWARVAVVLADNSGINVTGTKEERRTLVDEKVEWTKRETEKFLKNFNRTIYMQNISISSGGFRGLVSKEGLSILLNSSEVESVSWSQYKPELTESNLFYNPLFKGFILLIGSLFIISIYLIYKSKKRKEKRI